MVDWGGGVFAGCLPRVQLFVSACNGRPHLAFANQLPLPMIVKRGCQDRRSVSGYER